MEVIMNAKAETQGGRLDTLKLWAAILLMGAGIYGYYYFADVMVVLRVLGLLAVAAIAIGVVYQTGVGRQIVGFISGQGRMSAARVIVISSAFAPASTRSARASSSISANKALRCFQSICSKRDT